MYVRICLCAYVATLIAPIYGITWLPPISKSQTHKRVEDINKVNHNLYIHGTISSYLYLPYNSQDFTLPMIQYKLNNSIPYMRIDAIKLSCNITSIPGEIICARYHKMNYFIQQKHISNTHLWEIILGIIVVE